MGSTRAGYPIYRSTAESHYYEYIYDVGCRLEVNLLTGESINIWIDEPAELLELRSEVKALRKEVRKLKSIFEKEKVWIIASCSPRPLSFKFVDSDRRYSI